MHYWPVKCPAVDANYSQSLTKEDKLAITGSLGIPIKDVPIILAQNETVKDATLTVGGSSTIDFLKHSNVLNATGSFKWYILKNVQATFGVGISFSDTPENQLTNDHSINGNFGIKWKLNNHVSLNGTANFNIASRPLEGNQTFTLSLEFATK